MMTGPMSTGNVESSGIEQVISIFFAVLGDGELLVDRDKKKAQVTQVTIREESSPSAFCVVNVAGNSGRFTIGLEKFENFRKLKALIYHIGFTGLVPS